MKIYNIIQIPKGLSQEMECDCREEYYSGMTAGTEAQKAKLVSTAITENGTYIQEDGFNQVDVNVIKPDIYFPVNPMVVGSGANKYDVYIYTTGCTLDTTRSTIGGVGNIIGSFSEIQQSNSGSYYVTGYTNPNPTDKFRFGFISGKFYDTDGNLYTAKPCAVSQRPGPENQDYNSGYTAGLTACAEWNADLIANIQGDYFTIPEGVTKIRSHAFQEASFAESSFAITIPSSVTSIEEYAFAGSRALTGIVIPSSVQTVSNNVFDGCTSIRNATFENSAITSIGADMFKGCSNLKEVKLPDALTSLPEGTFERCYSLSSITIPSGVTSLGDSCFFYCESLNSIEIPSGVTSIGYSCFKWCSSLSSVTIPSSVTSIGRFCFENVSGLTYMRFESTTPPELIMDSDFDASLGSPIYTWPIYVPCEAVEAYRTAWPIYAHRISCPDLPKIAPVSVNEDTPDTGNDENTSSYTTDNIPK